MNKYVQNLIKNFRKQLEVWLNKQNGIQQKELYRFLHSIAGTAATIGFIKAGEMADALMSQLNETDQREWTKEEVQGFLLPLISIFYYEDPSNVDMVLERKKENDNEKLILLIDDDTTLLMYLKDELEKEGWIVFAVADPGRAVHVYYDLNPDCVIIDLHIKDENGLDVLVELKENMKQHSIPTMIISANNTIENRMKSYQLGADDFMEKPFDIKEFIIRVKRQLERKQVLDELVLVDEATKIFNWRFIEQAYGQLVGNLKRKKEIFTIALIDLDQFKQVNHQYGHLVGDKVLDKFTNVVRDGLRQNDIIIRYRADCFLLLLPEITTKDAKKVIERIQSQFLKTLDGDVTGLSCTFSTGIHEIRSAEVDFKTNLEIAKATLYEAKNEGGNSVKITASNDAPPAHKKLIHIGIIDDDPIIRTLLEDLIGKSKFIEGLALDIQSFKDGVEFLESNWHTRENEPYLMILDGMMPRMDGLEILQKLRDQRYQERFTVMMLTSRKSEQDISRALQLGADDYITKPFKLLELETRLSHLIKRMK